MIKLITSIKRKNWETIQIGAPANLVLLDKNSLENINNTMRISGVMHNKRWYQRQQLDLLLAKHQVK